MVWDKNKITAETLVVDDISDSGKTLKRLLGRKKAKVATLYFEKLSKFKPDFYCRIKKEWVVFPWETKHSSKYDKTVQIRDLQKEGVSTYNKNCKCVHHVIVKILVVLAWLSAIGFLIASKKDMFLNYVNTDWFYHVVVFTLLAFSTKFCGCCWRGKMGNAVCNCSCNNCEGGKCEGSHGEDHRNM